MSNILLCLLYITLGVSYADNNCTSCRECPPAWTRNGNLDPCKKSVREHGRPSCYFGNSRRRCIRIELSEKAFKAICQMESTYGLVAMIYSLKDNGNG
ncbi:hypothetical protein CHS0354_009004 [Potamilus streckersoni]|uniref:Uncharacterized protein n=1 Tax=Potamilus streckersoni TaxID=2493646 RepID=A0AAE0THK3_9BIVA|nr:hypothetical protein CHS0354_009004 [Potamilus streckersoni]